MFTHEILIPKIKFTLYRVRVYSCFYFPTIDLIFTNIVCIESRRGVGDKPMQCKPGVPGLNPGFSIHKTTIGEPSGAPFIKYTHKP